MVDHRLEALLAGLVVELLRACLAHAGDVAGRLDDGHLHAKADAQIGHVVLACELGRLDLALGAAFAEAAGHEDRVVVLEIGGGVLAVEELGIDPAHLDLHPVRHAAMGQCLGNGFVGILELRVLAHDGDVDLALGVVDALADIVPLLEVGARCRGDLERIQHRLVEPLAVIGERRVVDRRQVLRGDHAVGAHVAEQRQFLALLLRDRPLGAADEDVGRDADRAQLLDRVLRRLGLELAAGLDPGQQGQVHENALAARLVLRVLADRLEEGQALDVADGAADLAEHEVDLVLADREPVLDLVRDVGNHLDGLAQVIAAALLLEHVGIDPPRRDRVGLARRHAGEALVVAEIEIRLGAVIGDEDLAVLEGRHGARIDVEIGVELAQPDREAACLQQRTKRRAGKALAQRRNDTACDEDVTCHCGRTP